MAIIRSQALRSHLWSAFAAPPRNPLAEDAILKICAERDASLERMVGLAAEFLPFRFLAQGTNRGRAVARIEVRAPGPDGPEVIGTGTGFLVAPDLLLTNHHVLPTAEAAALSVVQFDYEVDLKGEECTPDPWSLAPEEVFVTSPFEALDMSLVLVKARDGAKPGESHGFVPLREGRAKVKVGERVHVIQHPAGRRKEVVLHESRVTEFLDGGYLRYTADTLVGSSGAPVFNDEWDVVGLHHRGVIQRDAQGVPVVENGDYVCLSNEGIRISSIVAFLRSEAVPETVRQRVAPYLYP